MAGLASDAYTIIGLYALCCPPLAGICQLSRFTVIRIIGIKGLLALAAFLSHKKYRFATIFLVFTVVIRLEVFLLIPKLSFFLHVQLCNTGLISLMHHIKLHHIIHCYIATNCLY